jgi:hypothetical protein
MRQRVLPFRVQFFSIVVVLTAAVIACAKSPDDKPSSGDPATPEVAPSAGGVASAGVIAAAGDNTSIIVNGEALTPETVQQLQQVYPVNVPSGRYWYDGVSGVWGREGEAVAGQMRPGLRLGGALAADASGGTSDVFINGRRLTAGEKRYIEVLCQTPALPGRYWVLANGIGGYEGQPALFNLSQCPGVQQQSSGPRSMSRTYCDDNGACTSTGILGSITTY